MSQIANGVTTNYTYNAANELITAGQTSYTYDANGNETGNSSGLAISYNNANQTTAITPPGGSATSMAYRGTGQSDRTSAGGTSFVSGLLGISSQTTSGQTTSYVRDLDGELLSEKLPNGNRYYYLFDGLGSVVGLTDSSGNVVDTYKYDSYGNITSSTGSVPNPWRFAGGYQDPTGLYKFGERYYDPFVGLWTQPDPTPDGFSALTYATYSYVGDDPTNYIDTGGGRRHYRAERPRGQRNMYVFDVRCDDTGSLCIGFRLNTVTGAVDWWIAAAGLPDITWGYEVTVDGVVRAGKGHKLVQRQVLHGHIPAEYVHPGTVITVVAGGYGNCPSGWPPIQCNYYVNETFVVP